MSNDQAFLDQLVAEYGYRHAKLIGGGRYACIFPKMFTHAIITGRVGDHWGFGDCWCYRSAAEAKVALDRWDGTGEPEGWIRHPASGRRVSLAADETDDAGRKIGAVGVPYVRG